MSGLDNVQNEALHQARDARLLRLIDALPLNLPEGQILDLGCADGSAAPLLKAKYHRSLEGVDLDPNAIGQAQNRNLYDQLYTSNLVTWEPEYPYALIHAAAVFHQCGSLEAVVNWFRQCLVSGGVLAFSLPRNQTSALAGKLRAIVTQMYPDRIAPPIPATGRLEEIYQWLAPFGQTRVFAHEELHPLPVSTEGHPLRLAMEDSFIRPMLSRLSLEEIEDALAAIDDALEQQYAPADVPQAIRLRESYAILQIA